MTMASKQFDMASATDVGRVRAHNEDSIAADVDLGLATLADGMGGYNAGEVASGIAVAMVPQEMRKLCAAQALHGLSDEAVQQLMAAQASKVNSAIYTAAQSQTQYTGMGTTLVIAYWHDDRVTVAHLGDSRCYRVRGAAVTPLTRDHSWIQEQIDAGLMTYEQARTSKKKNLVTRACGIDLNVMPEVHTHAVEAGDIYVLCSDGLYDMVPDEDIHLTVSSLKSNLTLAAQQLVQQANDNGGRDNISVILVHVLKVDQAPAGLVARLKNWFKGASKNPLSSFRRKPESRKINSLGTGFRRCDGFLEVPLNKCGEIIMSKVILSLEGSVIREVSLDKERVTIGRKPQNDIQIENLAVSSEHARIVSILNDSFLEDLGSTNGTMVNGNPIKKHILQNNDVIEIGKYTLKFVSDAPVENQASAEDFERTMVLRAPPAAQRAPAAPAPAAELNALTAPLPKVTLAKPAAPAAPAQKAAPAAAPQAWIQIMSGPGVGKEAPLTKNLTTLGKPGVQVAVIARRPQGYFITHVEGANYPVLNNKTLDTQTHLLNDHDLLEIAGVKMEFFFRQS